MADGGSTGPEREAAPGSAAGTPVLEGRRVLVVGGSAGIGRATALAAAAAGADVGVTARRADELAALAAEATVAATAADVVLAAARGTADVDVDGGGVGGHGRVAVRAADVRHQAGITAAVHALADDLGGLDTVVYCTGVNHLALLADTAPATWSRLFDTNVVGAAHVVTAALDHLRAAPAARVALLSSHSVPDPWPGLGAYAVTKAALEELVAAWRVEEPGLSFARIVIGPTVTGMADGWDPDDSARFFARWGAEGRFDGVQPMPPAWVAGRLVAWMAATPPPLEVDLFHEAHAG